jgi:hypothetical protein
MGTCRLVLHVPRVYDMNKNKILEIVNAWKINTAPKYREFRCAKCQRYIRKAWHVWFSDGGYKIEVHFCKNCFKELSD